MAKKKIYLDEAEVLNNSGGALGTSPNSPPTELAVKDYVDSIDTSLQSQITSLQNGKLNNTTDTLSGQLTMDGDILMGNSNVVQLGNGSDSAPSLAIASNPDTGIYKHSTESGVAFSHNGAEKGFFWNDGLSVNGQVLPSNGDATDPGLSFQGDSNTGFYISGTGEVSFTSNGNQRWNCNISGLQLGGGARIGSFTTDGTFSADLDTVVPSQKAVKTYVDNQIALNSYGDPLFVSPNYGSDIVEITTSTTIVAHGAGGFGAGINTYTHDLPSWLYSGSGYGVNNGTSDITYDATSDVNGNIGSAYGDVFNASSNMVILMVCVGGGDERIYVQTVYEDGTAYYAWQENRNWSNDPGVDLSRSTNDAYSTATGGAAIANAFNYVVIPIDSGELSGINGRIRSIRYFANNNTGNSPSAIFRISVYSVPNGQYLPIGSGGTDPAVLASYGANTITNHYYFNPLT
jgi:hypothetical protein